MPANICEAFPEIRKEWLLWGEGEMYKSEQQAVNAEKLIEEAAKVVTKPRLPITAAAGHLSDYLGGVLAHECEQVPVMRSIPDYDFSMIVKGDSMEPKFEGGDEIALKEVRSTIEWGKAYVLATRDGVVLKRLFPAEHGFRCVSYNHEEYPDFIVDEDDVFGKYRVVGLIRV
jgi:phage repressor protein C with HTH and peptisase S24 domain